MIKPLSKTDIPNILNLSASFKDAWTKDMLESGFSAGRLNALGKFEGQDLAGYALYSLGVDDADIEIIFVGQDFRRKGFASQLFVCAQEQIQKASKEKIFLEVRSSNLGAINLYSKLGFEKISKRKKYYYDGEDALVMVKEIKK